MRDLTDILNDFIGAENSAIPALVTELATVDANLGVIAQEFINDFGGTNQKQQLLIDAEGDFDDRLVSLGHRQNTKLTYGDYTNEVSSYAHLVMFNIFQYCEANQS